MRGHRNTRNCAPKETQTDLTSISASFLMPGTEHGGGDLVIVVIRSVTNSIADDGHVCLLKNVCEVT